MDYAELFSKLAPGAAALIAALVARSGLQTWRLQLRGQAQYELARRLLRALLRVRDQVDAVRSPMILAGEFAAAYEAAGLTIPENSVTADPKSSQLVYDRRWQALSAAMSELHGELVEAEVLWGAVIRQPEIALRKCYAELYSAVVMHLRANAASHVGEPLARVVESQFRVLYRVDSEADPDLFGKRVEMAVGEFELLLRPHLQLKSK